MIEIPEFINFVLESANMMDFVHVLPKSEPGLAKFLHLLALELHTRFQRTELVEYLDRAIAMGIEAVKSVSKDNPGDAALPNYSLGRFFVERFNCKGSAMDLDSAVEALEQASRRMPKDHPDYVFNLELLGEALGLVVT
jgi:hypothetical protein